jgi:Tfp pilus assembly protein FimT
MRDVEPNEANEAKNAAGLRRRVEWLLGVAIALVLAVAAIPGVRPLADRDLAHATVRGLEGLLRLARDEAVQTGEDHIVFFEHAAGGGLVGTDRGTPVMALLIRDRDGDGRRSESEYIASVPVDAERIVRWGSAFATKPADGDVASELSGPLSFGDSGTQVRARGLVFRADGAPHSYSSNSTSAGSGESGAGTLYLHGPTRDYAVVVSPWGDVDVQVWDSRSQSWHPAPTP